MALSEACNSSGCEAAAPERLCVWMPIAHRAWSRAAVAKVRDVAWWVPVGDGLTLKLTDLVSSF